MKLDTHGVGVLIRVSRSSRVSRIGRWYGMHGGREASDRQTGASQNGVLAPTLTEPRGWLHFPRIALSHSVYIRSVNAFVHATGCRNTLHRRFFLPPDVWIYVLRSATKIDSSGYETDIGACEKISPRTRQISALFGTFQLDLDGNPPSKLSLFFFVSTRSKCVFVKLRHLNNPLPLSLSPSSPTFLFFFSPRLALRDNFSQGPYSRIKVDERHVIYTYVYTYHGSSSASRFDRGGVTFERRWTTGSRTAGWLKIVLLTLARFSNLSRNSITFYLSWNLNYSMLRLYHYAKGVGYIASGVFPKRKRCYVIYRAGRMINRKQRMEN